MTRTAKVIKMLSIVFIIFGVCSQSISASVQQQDYTVNPVTGKREAIPLTYEYKETISSFGEYGFLNGVKGIYMSPDDVLYIADTGNDRIIKYDTFTGEIMVISEISDGTKLNAPEGVFADEIGSIFIADTGNERVLHLASDGEFIENFRKPESKLLGPSFKFNPRKVALSPTGYIYTIKDQSILQVDAYNNFRGFLGSIRVDFSFQSLLIRLFASDEQKRRLGRTEPASYLNFCIGPDGFIYATSLDEKFGQIKKLNSIGKNIYPEKMYGELFRDDLGEVVYPKFDGIAVDDNGIVSVLESQSGKIYQYTKDGMLLTVFGRNGNKKGMFSSASDIVVDSKGNIYVSDYSLHNVQVFKPTRFIIEIHEAVSSYQQGDYTAAQVHWKNVSDMCETYNLAFESKGTIAYKSKDYPVALEEFRKAEDKVGYSKAFTKMRHDFIRSNFPVVTITAVILIITAVWLIGKFRRASIANIDYMSERRSQK